MAGSVVTSAAGALVSRPRSPSALGWLGVSAVAGVGLLAGVTSAVAGLMMQARTATRSIQSAAMDAALAEGLLVPPAVPGATHAQQHAADLLVHIRLPHGDGIYRPDGRRAAGRFARSSPGRPLSLVILGDSTSVGYGTRTPDELPGVILARGAAAALGRDVELHTHGLTGAGSADLPRQLAESRADLPDAVVILIGGNDIRDMVPPGRSAARLGDAVSHLTSRGVPVVVGTCPDFGVLTPIPQPLRSMLSTWSLRLAALQERATAAAGGVSVALARLVSPQFVNRPDLFAPDRFHPSGPGYRRAMDVLLPALVQTLSDRRRRPVPEPLGSADGGAAAQPVPA